MIIYHVTYRFEVQWVFQQKREHRVNLTMEKSLPKSLTFVVVILLLLICVCKYHWTWSSFILPLLKLYKVVCTSYIFNTICCLYKTHCRIFGRLSWKEILLHFVNPALIYCVGRNGVFFYFSDSALIQVDT